MDDDVQSLIGEWGDEMAAFSHGLAHEQIICCFADLIRMRTALISLSQPLLADRVRNIQDMKLVGDVSLSYQ